MDRKPKCCRQLFPDDDGRRRVPVAEDPAIQAFLAEERRRARERWNYDFENDRPLKGRYEWVLVAPPNPPAPDVLLNRAGRQSHHGEGAEATPTTPPVAMNEGVSEAEDTEGNQDLSMDEIGEGEEPCSSGSNSQDQPQL